MADPRPTNTGFDPAFGQSLKRFRDALAAQGVQTNIISGVRSPQEHQMAWANFQAGRAGQPLPYADFGPVSRATAPGDVSTHDVGLGADVQPVNRADLPRMYAMAPKFGISYLGASDPLHFQLANWQQQAANQPAGMPWATAVAAAQGGRTQLAEGGENISGPTPSKPGEFVQPGTGTPIGTTINSQGASPAGSKFISALAQIESGNRNIFSGVDKDYPGQPGSRSQGYYQIDTPTWQQFAAKAGVDVSKYPSAMNAPQDVQAQVAALIPLSRFGARTQKMLGQQFGQLDTSKTIGELAGGAPAAPTATAAAGGAPGAPTPAAGGDGLNPGFTTKSASDAFQKGFEGLDKAMGGKGQGQGQGGDQSGPPEVRESPMVGQRPSAQNVSPLLAMTPMTYGQTINTLQDPRAWSNAPGSPQGTVPAGMGQQGPMGTSINSLSQMLGADPSMAQFPQIDPRLALMGLGGMSGGYG